MATATNRRCWTDEDLAFLREHRGQKTARWIADRLGRTPEGVAKMARRAVWNPGRAPDRHAEILQALRADLAEHGRVSSYRVARAVGVARTTVDAHYARARREGDMPPAARWAPPSCPEPAEDPAAWAEYRAGVEARTAAVCREKEEAGEPYAGRSGEWLPPGAAMSVRLNGRVLGTEGGRR
jgi:hypothetical protein